MDDGKPLSICPVCECDPCDCHGTQYLHMVKLKYYVGDKSFTIVLPKRLVNQYKCLYRELEVMQADGSVVVYSSGAVAKNEDNKESYK